MYVLLVGFFRNFNFKSNYEFSVILIFYILITRLKYQKKIQTTKHK
jgi:hypothetical protein